MSEERKNYREKLDNAPDELKALPNWVCYRMEERYGQPKPTKVPYNPITGDKAKANDATTWTDYETCVAAVERGEYDGVGFEFGNGYVGVDLDHCRDDETGKIEDWANEIIAHLHSYTEVSPSGTGVHIIIKGKLPSGGRRIGPIEMYDTARYFTVTDSRSPEHQTGLKMVETSFGNSTRRYSQRRMPTAARQRQDWNRRPICSPM